MSVAFPQIRVGEPIRYKALSVFPLFTESNGSIDYLLADEANHLLLEEIDPSTFAETSTELRDREAKLKLQIDGSDKERHEIIDIAVKAFELSQNLRAKWFEADYAAKRRILEIVCLNWTLDGVNLVPTMRKPFDMLAEGLVWKNSRVDGI
jgi:site-specific DNA recombinase